MDTHAFRQCIKNTNIGKFLRFKNLFGMSQNKTTGSTSSFICYVLLTFNKIQIIL